MRTALVAEEASLAIREGLFDFSRKDLLRTVW